PIRLVLPRNAAQSACAGECPSPLPPYKDVQHGQKCKTTWFPYYSVFQVPQTMRRHAAKLSESPQSTQRYSPLSDNHKVQHSPGKEVLGVAAPCVPQDFQARLFLLHRCKHQPRDAQIYPSPNQASTFGPIIQPHRPPQVPLATEGVPE